VPNGRFGVETLVIGGIAEMLQGQDRTFYDPITLQTLLVAAVVFRPWIGLQSRSTPAQRRRQQRHFMVF
jgi:hypothetical protein